MPQLAAINIYPVKSCRGVAVSAAEVDGRGLVGDRRFLVVDGAGRFLTQRAHPRMALIEAALIPGELVLSSAGRNAVHIPLQRGPPCPELRTVTVWQDTVTADDCGEEPAAWLSEFLGLPCRLVRAGAAYTRPLPARKLPSTLHHEPRTAHEVSFADGYPFLAISEESLADLNARLDTPLPMNRFRPNLVVAGGAPYAEDEWGRLRIGTVVFHGATCCGRCTVTTTDQFTAERGKEPLRTLATYRRDAAGDVMFGRNLVHETKGGRVTVGNPVEFL